LAISPSSTRQRKLDLHAFAWALALGSGSSGERTITSIYQSYDGAVREKHRMVESCFGDWIRNPNLPAWIQAVVLHAIGQLEDDGGNSELAAELGKFRELLVADSSVIRLHWSLRDLYPGSRKNHSPAAIKVHMVQKTRGGGIHHVSLTDGKTSDSKVLEVGPWVTGSLLLIDLGYYDFARFARIERLGGFFISRVKDGANPEIVASLRVHRGQQVVIAGERLQAVLKRMRRKVIDIQVRVSFNPKTKGESSRQKQDLRMVGIWDEYEGEYHLYFTNVPPEMLTAEAVAQAYRLRWQVELLFRELKKTHRMEDLRTMDPDAAVALVYASILSLLVTRALLRAIREKLELEESAIPFERGAAVIGRQAPHLLRLVTRPPWELGRTECDVNSVLLRMAPDPNRRRPRTLLARRRNLMLDPYPKFMIPSGIEPRHACRNR
jgi:IS4 transposase